MVIVLVLEKLLTIKYSIFLLKMKIISVVIFFTLTQIADYAYGACGSISDQDCPSKLIWIKFEKDNTAVFSKYRSEYD